MTISSTTACSVAMTTKRQYDKSSWFYQLDEQGNALRDETLSHPRCVWNLLKAHVDRYTPEMVNRLCGTSVADFNRICEILASTSVPDRTATILYALGWTPLRRGTDYPRRRYAPVATGQYRHGGRWR